MFFIIKLFTELFEIEVTISIKMDLALNNLQWLICNKTQPTKQRYLKSFECVQKLNYWYRTVIHWDHLIE